MSSLIASSINPESFSPSYVGLAITYAMSVSFTWLPCKGSTSMHIRYVPRERPPFLPLNFSSGAYHFHRWQKFPLRRITVLHFLPLRRPTFSKFLYIQAVPCRARSAYCSPPERKEFGQQPGVSGRPDASYSQFQSPHCHAWARSGALHFHPRARSGTPPFFTLPRHIPSKIWGESGGLNLIHAWEKLKRKFCIKLSSVVWYLMFLWCYVCV